MYSEERLAYSYRLLFFLISFFFSSLKVYFFILRSVYIRVADNEQSI